MNKVRFLMAFLGLIWNGPAFSAVSAYPITNQDKAFVAVLKEAIITDQREWIAERISFPIQVKIHGKRELLQNRSELLAHYKDVFDQKVIGAIERQDPEKLFKNSHGTMIGDGELWYTTVLPAGPGQQPEIYIIGINN